MDKIGLINKKDSFLDFLIDRVLREDSHKTREDIPDYLERTIKYKAVREINFLLSEGENEGASAIKRFVGLTDEEIDEINKKTEEENR